MRRNIFDPLHDEYRASVREFLRREGVPHVERWEEAGQVDRTFWTKAAQAGLLGFEVPEEYGGSGLRDFRYNAIVNEEMNFLRVSGDYLLLANDIIAPYLLDLTTEAQKERWLPGFASGATVAAIAMSEPEAGSDLRGIRALVTPHGAMYRLSGNKTFVTSGIQAGLVIVFAHFSPGGYVLVVVEDGMPGFERGRKLAKIGRRSTDTAELFFDNVPIPPENILGTPGEGLGLVMRNLPRERLGIAVGGLAAAEAAFDATLTHVKGRNAFGQPVGSFQAIRFMMAEMRTELSVARAYIDRCICAVNSGELGPDEAAGAKYWTTELQNRVIDTCLQLHGGYGYMEEYPIARQWRDARVQRIYGGTNEIMRDIVGRSLGL